eukprot:GHVP01030691.1.p1 GENE.GHVP01030691.1~~GHVP01030691.1.p1  ORF type:complete len:184 (-),score=21.11 GHVP01030691.1:644-1195(-)
MDRMGNINLGKVEHVKLYNKAFFILPKMGFIGGNGIDWLTIDTKDSEIDSETIKGICNTFLGIIENAFLHRKAFYVLPKISTINGSGIGTLDLDIKCPDIDSEKVSRMGDISLGKVESLVLRNNVFYILPSVRKVEKNEIENLRIDTEALDVNSLTVDEIGNINLGKAESMFTMFLYSFITDP